MTWSDWNPYYGIPFWTILAVGGSCLFFLFYYEWYAVRRRGRRTAQRRNRSFWMALMVFYVFTILCATYFGREPDGRQEIRWRLFWTLEAALETGEWQYWYYIFGNITLFIPLGYILWNLMAGRRRGLWSVVICLILSCCIECVQYITATGLSELDDLFHNTLGGVIGVLVAWGIGHGDFTKKQTKD